MPKSYESFVKSKLTFECSLVEVFTVFVEHKLIHLAIFQHLKGNICRRNQTWLSTEISCSTDDAISG